MDPIFHDKVQEIMFYALKELENRILMGTDIRILNFHLNSTLEETGQIVSRFIYGFNPDIRKNYIQNALNHFNFSDSKGRMSKHYRAYNPKDMPLRTLANKDYHELPFYYSNINPIQPLELAPDQEPEKSTRKGRHWNTMLPQKDESPTAPFAFTHNDTSNDHTAKMLRFFHHCLEQHCPYVRSFMRVTQPHINPRTYLESKKKLYNSVILTFSGPLSDSYQQIVAKKTRDFIVQYLIDYHVQSALEGFENWQKIAPAEALNSPITNSGLLEKRPKFESAKHQSNEIKNRLYHKLMHQAPEEADQVFPGLMDCINNLERNEKWASPLQANLERVRTIYAEVEARRMDITRFVDNIRARIFTLTMHLVFDWSVYSINFLLVRLVDLSTAKNQTGIASPEVLKEFNRFVYIRGLKNDTAVANLKKRKNEHRYVLQIVKYLAQQECVFLKNVIEAHQLEIKKQPLLQALNDRLAQKT